MVQKRAGHKTSRQYENIDPTGLVQSSGGKKFENKYKAMKKLWAISADSYFFLTSIQQ